MSQPIRIMLADDHAHARQAMREIIQADPEFEIICEATNGKEAVMLAEQWMPDVILMDIRMPELDGLEATKLIKERFPYVKIVMVTVSDDITHLFEALKKGAQGYLLKNLHPASWHEYLRAVAIDEAPMSREIAVRLLQEFSSVRQSIPDHSPLTGREKEILECVAKGNSNREISEILSISEHTVKNHLKNILHKLHLDNRVQLMRYAYEKGWIRG
ncbi:MULTISPECIES: response regulator [Paenibacillus]|uniref:Chemotaxis protein CheY n=3 Tax=Paenibacillus TaxID=44249 RepID=A0A081P8I0_9BACL|nr:MULTISPECIES: response regulator transcription factor [Paenibacillus]KEQ27003.1 chemotaxis protein CheY [Paenibacillus tyrfis]KZE76126.1 two-component system response regulator [Paenibacillus elgii]MBU7317954.1 response regulator transcription factor [Paenibacillus oleatilyticus]MCM3271920.1 response regulator transcription factor [Paenibacillus elgii]NEN86261.1 response regulator transcription factor [Paenibacillus elgii]